MYNVTQLIDNSRFLIYLNTLPDPKDAVANDVQYHQCCWVYAQCEAQRKVQSSCHETLRDEKTSRVIADMEILNICRTQLDRSDSADLNMNNSNTTYINLLQDNDCPEIWTSYKKYLKNSLQKISKMLSYKAKTENQGWETMFNSREKCH